ncbi:caspase family protein [Streptomyces sp. NPDC050504]|uniref:HD domain-containing protein n=1 Tax=Streptomyces sp. NPDC050504 TaxID=3365618 RepID=UPI0037B14B0B
MGAENTQGSWEAFRRALVMGVSETRFLRRDPDLDERYPGLGFVERDVRRVSTALTQSGYEVTAPDPEDGELLRNVLLRRLRGFFRSCAPGDTAFVYLSCHGVRLGDRDFLVPADAQPGDLAADGTRELLADSLVPADPGTLLTGLRPGVTVTVCLDMCRTDEEGSPPGRPVRFEVSDKERIFWLFASSPGQAAHAHRTDGSHFGQALAEAIAPTSPPTTFDAIVEHTRAALRRLSADLPHPPPDLDWALAPAHRAAAAELKLCRGSQETRRWSTAVTESGLWRHTSGDEATHERVKDRLVELARRVAAQRAGRGTHHDDPWDDPGHPERVMDRLALLVERAGLDGRQRLSPAETAVLLAAPLLHEAVVVLVLNELHTVSASTSTDALPEHLRQVRGAADDVRRAHSQTQRTLDTLRRRGLHEAAHAAELWLRHRFIAGWDRPWERNDAYRSIDGLIRTAADAITAAFTLPGQEESAPALAPAPSPAPDRIKHQIRQVAGHLTVRPAASPRINESDHTDGWSTRPPGPGNQWRGRELAQLLWTAGLLAVDPRLLSGVVVDHLGAHSALRPRETVAALAAGFHLEPVDKDGREDASSGEGASTKNGQGTKNGKGTKDGKGGPYALSVHFPCPHPALHFAVEGLVARVNDTLSSARGDTAPLLRGLPDRVTAEHLYALDDAYQQPLERFQLSEDEIRPLLMGTQLYGDRMLAVRELYQNALDACRHRTMRVGYAQRRGTPDADWRAHISFTQGWDEGRPYIECQDNGTGMSREKLVSMFARAGRRYEQDPDFVQERRNWRRAGLADLDLNSRFGIGVFSYFMLADEVVVWTRPVNLLGIPVGDRGVRAEIQAGSGLVQVRHTEKAPPGGGTRVRLYLSTDDGELPSLVETLRSTLWVSDHRVTATECAQDAPERVVRAAAWEPGELTASASWDGGPLPAGGDAWLVQGEGRVLLDGVVVGHAEKPYGRVVNLRARHRPVPSVDRNQMLSYDEGLALAELLDAVPEAAKGWPEVQLSHLWVLAKREPRLVVALLSALRPDVVAVLQSGELSRRLLHKRMPLALVGCLPFDQSESERDSPPLHRPGREHEDGLLRAWQRSRLGLAFAKDEPFVPASYAAPSAIDALLFHSGLPREDWGSALQTAALASVPLADAVRALRRHAIAGLHVPAADDPRSLRTVRPTPVMTHLYQGYTEVAGSPLVDDPQPPAVHAPLVWTSAVHDITLGEAAQQLDRLLAIDAALPAAPRLDEELMAQSFTTAEAEFLARRTSGAWNAGALCRVDRLSRTGPLLSERQLVSRIRQLAPLGFSLCPEPGDEQSAYEGLTPNERRLFSVRSDGQPSWRTRDLLLTDVLRAAADLNATVGDVLEQIEKSRAKTGLSGPAVPSDAHTWTPPHWLGTPFVEEQDPTPLTPWQFACYVNWYGQTPQVEEMEHHAQMLIACGLLAVETPLPLSAVTEQAVALSASPIDAYFLAEEAATITDGSLHLSLPALLAQASTNNSSLEEFVGKLAEERPTLPLDIAEVPWGAGHLEPTTAEVHAITEVPHDGRRRFRCVSIADVLRCAYLDRRTLGTAHTRLAEYVLLGAPPPPGDLTAPGAEPLLFLRPTRFDLAAFDAGLLGPGTLGPLELVLVAGRFSWTIGQAYERYAPFRHLGLAVAVREPTPEEAAYAPDWRDVVILTEQLTGRAPALHGTLTPDDVLLRSEETDLTPREVHERLTRWARLFDLAPPKTPPAS